MATKKPEAIAKFFVSHPLVESSSNGRQCDDRRFYCSRNWGKERDHSCGRTPTAACESVIMANMSPGSYTAIIRGVNNTTGVALVEVYDLH
jgi:hypothetical protein